MWMQENNYCGGYEISVKVVNQDGKQCLTTAMDADKGQALVWTIGQGLGSSCLDMVVTERSTVYIQSTSGDDFCPWYVWVTTTENSIYNTKKITDWYDKQTNNKKHALTSLISRGR